MSAERYWEERWRTEKAENERLRAIVKRMITAAEAGCINWMPLFDEARTALETTPGETKPRGIMDVDSDVAD